MRKPSPVHTQITDRSTNINECISGIPHRRIRLSLTAYEEAQMLYVFKKESIPETFVPKMLHTYIYYVTKKSS